MNTKPFYITTTLPYVNDIPHLGHAMEAIRADVIARYKRSTGVEVFFNRGTDEHGQKIYEGAIKEGMDTKAYADKYSERFRDFDTMCDISADAFLRTTDEKHIQAAQKMWNIALAKGDIYKAKQTIKYCVGCEMEKTDSELGDDGKCADHPNRDLVVSEEENYFFRFSKYEKDLLALYERGLVLPDFRQNEIKKFVEGGLHDFSVSRLKSKMPWGVSVPGDDEHVMYVWFDALNSYISTLGWGSEDETMFEKYWQGGTVLQVCGKDNNKAQSAIWQAMLLSAGIKNTDTININGHIISGGVKMSKSIGNVISPFEIVESYKEVTDHAAEVLRFVMCHEVSTYDDSDITHESIALAYRTHLQNGIGNQVNRILKLTSQYLSTEDIKALVLKIEEEKMDSVYTDHLENFRVSEAVHMVTDKVKLLDEYIQSTEPFKLVKNEETLEVARDIMRECILRLGSIGHHLYFFMPRTAMALYTAIETNRMPEKPLFNRFL